jgi:hypothetical protein
MFEPQWQRNKAVFPDDFVVDFRRDLLALDFCGFDFEVFATKVTL